MMIPDDQVELLGQEAAVAAAGTDTRAHREVVRSTRVQAH